MSHTERATPCSDLHDGMETSCVLVLAPSRGQDWPKQHVPPLHTWRASTTRGSSDFFMCAQAWNCWLMQVRKVAIDRKTSAGAGSHGVASRHSAAKGAAGLNTWRPNSRHIGCEYTQHLWP